MRFPVSTPGVQLQGHHVEVIDQQVRWSLTKRIAFRFCFVYFGLFCLLTQVLLGLVPLPSVDIPDPSTLWPFRQIVFWTATHVFHLSQPLVYQLSGSGDKTYDWVLQFCFLMVALLATVIWSLLDRKRENYATAYKWFRLFVRFCLAGQMLSYGWAKAVPLQMPYPRLFTLIEPYGNFSPMGVLWASIGAAPAYQIFAGCAEIVGGVLLIIPRVTMLGALICLADMTQVFMLNMTYDVPVKLFSFHMILLSLFLLAPDIKRLLDLFFFNRPVQPSTQFPLFAMPRANSRAAVLQIVFGIFLMGMNAYGSWILWHTFGGGSPKSPLYGIWNVEQLVIDGQPRPPLMSDGDRWRRLIFDVPARERHSRRWTSRSPALEPRSILTKTASRSPSAATRTGRQISPTPVRPRIAWCSTAKSMAIKKKWSCNWWIAVSSCWLAEASIGYRSIRLFDSFWSISPA